MSFFKEVEGEAAVLVENGVFRQVPLYTRDGFIFAKVGSNGFVRLMADGSTTKSKLRLDFMSWGSWPLYKDRIGRLCTGDAKGIDFKLLDGAAKQKLLGA
jgi:hypothetical protein